MKGIFIKTNDIKLVFNMIWLLKILSLNRGTAADKILSDKTFNIAKYPKDDGYQHGLASLVYELF